MKLYVLMCLVAVSQANIFDDLKHTLGGAVNTVGHAVDGAVGTVGHTLDGAVGTVGHALENAGNTALHGLTDAGQVVGGALSNVGQTLGGTFGDVWNVVKDPLAEAGKEVLVHAAEFALEQGVTMALDALAAGKRDTSQDLAKTFLLHELQDEYQKWLADTESDVKGSRQEMVSAMTKHGFQDLPGDIKSYISRYLTAVHNSDTAGFVGESAKNVMQDALKTLPARLTERLRQAMSTLVKNA